MVPLWSFILVASESHGNPGRKSSTFSEAERTKRTFTILSWRGNWQRKIPYKVLALIKNPLNGVTNVPSGNKDLIPNLNVVSIPPPHPSWECKL